MQSIKIPSEPMFVADLVLQRTGPFIKLGGGNALNQWFSNGNKIGLNDFLVTNNLLDRYVTLVLEEINAELSDLERHVPTSNLRRIVSIGPGNGLLELLLISRGYTEKILLIDIERTASHHHGFNRTGSGYANLKATTEFIVQNLSQRVEISTCNPLLIDLPNFEFSLLISFLSMGFHYPCDDYSEFITRHAENDAIVSFDKRRDSQDAGFQRLSQDFTVKSVISGQKSDRLILHRPIVFSTKSIGKTDDA